MLRIETTVDAQGAITGLDIFGASGNVVKKALEESKKVLIASTDKTFRAQGRPAWPPLSPRTIENRRHGKKKSNGTKALQDTGRLKNSIGGEISGNELTFGTSVEYGVFHQFGIGVPARPFVVAQPEDIERILEIFAKAVSKEGK